jgi:mono/diheme cytochrome c family protein
MRRLALITAAALGFAAGFNLWSAGNGERGQQLFVKMCSGCHALDSEK